MIEREGSVKPESDPLEDSWVPEAKWDWDETDELVATILPRTENKEIKPWYEQGIKMQDPEEIGWTGVRGGDSE